MWPFKRKKRYRPSASYEIWRIGDIAECTEGGDWLNLYGEARVGPKQGDRSIVTLAGIAEEYGVKCLCLVGWPGRVFNAAAFRKITDVGVEEPRRHAVTMPRETIGG